MTPSCDIHVSIDVGCHSHSVAVGLASGEVLDEFELAHRPEDFALLFKRVDGCQRRYGGEVSVAMEGYNGWARPLDTLVRSHGYRLYNINNLKLARFKEIFPGAAKTDRIDAKELAQFYANGLLTIVSSPDVQVEHDRDLLRSRQQLMHQQGALRRHIQSLLRRNGFDYKAQTQRKTHSRKHHYAWLDKTIERCPAGLRTNLSLLLRQLKSFDAILVAYTQQVQALALTPRYREPVKALSCYTGIKHLFALTMITEVGDVKRFADAQKLVSWIGMDIREYASGGKSSRFGITGQGNRYLRTAFIEANQRGYRTARLSEDIKARRAAA